MKPNWTPDLHIKIYELIGNKYDRKSIITGAEIIERMKRMLYRIERKLYWVTINEMVWLGLLDKVSDNCYRLGNINTERLIKLNNLRARPKSKKAFPIT